MATIRSIEAHCGACGSKDFNLAGARIVSDVEGQPVRLICPRCAACPTCNTTASPVKSGIDWEKVKQTRTNGG